MGDNGLPVKSPACAYVGSNPTPATHNCRSGPVCGPGLMQLWATRVPGDSRRAWILAITEGEYPPGGTAVRLVHIDSGAPKIALGSPVLELAEPSVRRAVCSLIARVCSAAETLLPAHGRIWHAGMIFSQKSLMHASK
jgi:hypothetical protein